MFPPRIPRKRLLLSTALFLIALWTSGYWVLPWLMPVPAQLRQPPTPGLDFRDRNGLPLRKTLAGGSRIEAPLRFGDMPSHLVRATVCAEDKRFWSHGGIDFLALARAGRDAACEGRIVSGASTITQQLVKISSPRRARSPKSKLIEMLTARKLEMMWSKERILSEYLNRLDYGNLLVGCAAASRGYFDKPPSDLTLAECAFLAGIPQAPTRLNPRFSRERTTSRQHWILKKMYREGSIDESAVSRAILQPLRLSSAYHVFEAPHAIDLLLKLGCGDFPGGSGAAPHLCRTTIDLELQREVDAILKAALDGMSEQHARHGAVVVIDNATGDVISLAGSGDYFSEASGQLNGAWVPRSPGSALKPFTYLLALEKGDSPATLVHDLPVEYPGDSGVYRPVNYDRRYYGPMTYRVALANSLNVSAVKVLERIGGPAPLHEALRACGIDTLREAPRHYGLGLTLGNAEVRLLELTNAYACLARLGIHKPWRLLLNQRQGRAEASLPSRSDQPRPDTSPAPAASRHPSSFLPPPSSLLPRPSFHAPLSTPPALQHSKINNQQSPIANPSPLETPLFSPSASYLLADILSDPLARCRAFGTHSVLDLPFRVACKTGTSTDFRDNWTLGYTPEYTVGVWIGNFTNEPMHGVSGVTGAAPVFREIFTMLHRRFGMSWFPRPADIVEAAIDIRNGKQWREEEEDGDGGTSGRLRPALVSLAKRTEIFRAGNLPPVALPGDYDAAGRARFPENYASWLRSEDNWLGARAAFCGEVAVAGTPASHAPRPAPPASSLPPEIVFPVPGSTFYLDPDLPGSGERLPLRVRGGVPVDWRSDTVRIERESDGSAVARLVPGRHRITALGLRTGRIAEAWVTVEEM